MPDTSTPNLDLDLPQINPTYDIFGAKLNSNFTILDAASITLRGTPVAATAPTSDQALVFNGTAWTPKSLALADLSDNTTVLLASGARALTGALSAGSFKITNLAAPTASADAATKGYVDGITPPPPADASTTVKGITKLSVAPVSSSNPIAVGDNDTRNTNSRAPSGTASGDLGSSYPSPTVVAIQGTPVLSTAPTAGQALVFNGTQWAPATMGAGTVTGSGTTGKLPKWSSSSALTDSIASESAGVMTFAGIVNVTGSYQVSGVQIASGNLSDSSSLIKTGTTLGGDLSGNLPNPTVAKVNGLAVTNPTSAGQTLRYNGTALVGAFLASTDLSDSSSLIKTSTTLGGDLSGSLPNPTVAKVNGISLSGTPSAGQVLTATSSTAANWQTPSGGGSGYATVVVAAPTGVPATDTANIQGAISGLGGSGGTVALREGTYVVNATITLVNNVTIVGQGRSSTVVQAASTMGAIATIDGHSTTHARLCHLTLDFNFSGRGSQATNTADIRGGVTSILEDVILTNGATNVCANWPSGMLLGCEFFVNGNSSTGFIQISGGGTCQVCDCSFNITTASPVSVIIVNGYAVVRGNVFVMNGNVSTFVSCAGQRMVATGNFFQYVSGSVSSGAIRTISMSGVAASIVNNVADSTSLNSISTDSTTVVIVGNSGFSAYIGGTAAGNI